MVINSQRGPNGDSGLALTPTLMLSFGLLVLLGVGAVLSVQWITGRSMIQEFAGRLIARNRFRELNDLARSFNAMLEGLKAFGRYVPRTLVMRLVKEGQDAAGSEERVLAIMFTDIAGFTSTCEDMSAAEVADFINHHLALISNCIEREGRTIDKYIGDAVMAFWGAPNRVENPAACACRAAVAIEHVIAADNAERAARQLKPVQVRIGIHMGPVVVGDIGAPNRINYTIVGDAVNATQRLEGLGKTVDPDAEVIVLISSEVREVLPKGFELVSRDAQPRRCAHDADCTQPHR